MHVVYEDHITSHLMLYGELVVSLLNEISRHEIYKYI